MEEIAIALLALSLALFAVSVLIVVRVVRKVGRGVERARQGVRRTLTDAALTARAVQPGLLGEVARTRRELRASLEATRGALLAGSERDPALREALTLVDQLTGHAERLDGELAVLMTGEPDRPVVSARLPALRTRAERIRHSADSLRAAAQDRAHHDNAEGLDALHQRIAIEANALRHWSPASWEPGRKAVEDTD